MGLKSQLCPKKTFCSRNVNELAHLIVAQQGQDVAYYTSQFQQQIRFVSFIPEGSVCALNFARGCSSKKQAACAPWAAVEVSDRGDPTPRLPTQAGILQVSL